MNFAHVRHTISILIAIFPVGCSSVQQETARPLTADAAGVVTHRPSGMRFPDHVDDFRRVRMIQYDKEGLDVSAGYNSMNPATPIVATVYVYPAPTLTSIGSPTDVVASAREHLCLNEFSRRKAELVHFHPDAKLIAEQDISLMRDHYPVAGKKASYEFSGAIGGAQSPLSSELYVFCYVADKWAVQYRFSWPREARATQTVSSFIDDLPWTISTAP